tara:strand:+ start:170 stop:352 length:183 start_codon:yes stop_codon:yes gene_type:complete
LVILEIENMDKENAKNCPECDAPTLEQTNTQENCYNCGYDKVYFNSNQLRLRILGDRKNG